MPALLTCHVLVPWTRPIAGGDPVDRRRPLTPNVVENGVEVAIGDVPAHAVVEEDAGATPDRRQPEKAIRRRGVLQDVVVNLPALEPAILPLGRVELHVRLTGEAVPANDDSTPVVTVGGVDVVRRAREVSDLIVDSL